MDQQTSIIKKIIEQLLDKMGFSGTVDLVKTDTDDAIYSISTDNDSHLLIGQHGINLQAFQHIARLIVRKQFPEKIRFSIDINDYRQQKNHSIVELAHQAAQEAIAQHHSVIMRPMSTYERRIVHLELSKSSEVVTESTGEGESRKIIVKPADMLAA
ncbi:MAG: R3H domain-containing nucleic acid-binding protein [Candidatus Moraniibacteriota bacterium]